MILPPACPGGAATPCTNRGVCNQGMGGTGKCTCGSNAQGPFFGPDCSSPSITNLAGKLPAPLNGPTTGGTDVTIQGQLFGLGAQVLVGKNASGPFNDQWSDPSALALRCSR